jgi:hypothetical protein
MNSRQVHVLVLANINASDREITSAASDLIIRACDQSSAVGSVIDFKSCTFDINNENIKFTFHADLEVDERIKKIEYIYIFIQDITELNNARIILKENGKLFIPNIHIGSMGVGREIGLTKMNVLVIGNSNFTDEQNNQLKTYTKNNQIIYVGNCNYTKHEYIQDMFFELGKKVYYDKAKKMSDAYIKGAAVGVFIHLLPPEVALHLASFLSRKDGGRLARTCKNAAQTAQAEEQKENKKKPKK